MASHFEDTATATPSHRWEEAGEAWGSRAIDWSCLYEHYSLDILVALLPRLGVGPGTSLLDVACGSGLAVRVADGMGADVAGIDAAAELVAVACDRTPTADLRVGSMFELPWADGRFDAVLSVNGIWGGCGKALDEIHRVLRPSGLLAISFWGQGPPLDIREAFKVFAFHAPEQHRDSMRRLNDIAAPGVAEEMLETEWLLGARTRRPCLDDGVAGRGNGLAGNIQRGTGGARVALKRHDNLARRLACRTRAMSGLARGVSHLQ